MVSENPDILSPQAQFHTFTVAGLGSFTCHRPTVGDYIKIGRRYTQLTGAEPLTDTDALVLAKITATIETIADDLPKGASVEQLTDIKPVFDFWTEYSQWLDAFRTGETAPAA
jgi:hypothetical protein